MQPLNLPLMRRFRVPPYPGIERPRRLILKLLLPGVNLVGMDLVALRKVRDRRLLPQRLQRDLRLQSGVNPPPRPQRPAGRSEIRRAIMLSIKNPRSRQKSSESINAITFPDNPSPFIRLLPSEI